MSETRFYHMQRSNLEEVLKTLLERVYARGQPAVVLAGSEERVEALSAYLWTYHERSFLPHGTKRDGREARQPIFLTSRFVNPNGAAILIQCDGADWPTAGDFPTICDLFDGNDPQAVVAARDRWRVHKEEGRSLLYFQQNASGKWEESARA